MKSSKKNEVIIKNKKSAWDLIKEIPDTPNQRKIDREIAAIERKYESKNKKKQKNPKINKNNTCKRKKDVKIYKIDDFGYFAGKIWDALKIYGPLDKSSLINNTKLNLNDFFFGIGWLARENKISREMNYYKLDTTNLTYEIGENAGKIWKILDTRRQANIAYILKSTHMKKEDIYSAIGWLSRENKLRFYYKNNQFLYELN